MALSAGCQSRGIHLPSALPPITDPPLIARWLSEITGESLWKVQRRLAAECRLVGHNVRAAARQFRLAPHVWSEQLLEFYGRTDAFLYETTVWNASGMKQRLRERVCAELTFRLRPGAEVLCFGDGMGFDSAAIARHGFKVTCFEISGPCLEFARRVFELNGLDCSIVTDESGLSPETYDAIVCLDVLEHVADPPALVQRFAMWLKATGLLVVHAPFYHVDATRPTHLRCNRRYAGKIAGLYRKAGFRIVTCGGLLLNPLVLRKHLAEQESRLSLPVRLRLGLSQSLAWLARYLPLAPGIAASVLCRPNKAWRRQLVDARPGATLSLPQRQFLDAPALPARKCA